MAGDDYSGADLTASAPLKKAQHVIAEQKRKAEEDAAAFQAKIDRYHGLTEDEIKAAKAGFNEWYASPAGHSGLDMGDVLTTPDDALLAWLALTALIKNTKGR